MQVHGTLLIVNSLYIEETKLDSQLNENLNQAKL
jgi:hypothetical protein